MTDDEKTLKAYEAVAYEVALGEAENVKMTPEIRREARVLVEYARDRIAEMRRAERKGGVVKSGVVRPAIIAMAREAILARFGELCFAHPQVVLAHRDFEAMTDDDLRSALEDVESTLERTE